MGVKFTTAELDFDCDILKVESVPDQGDGEFRLKLLLTKTDASYLDQYSFPSLSILFINWGSSGNIAVFFHLVCLDVVHFLFPIGTGSLIKLFTQ